MKLREAIDAIGRRRWHYVHMRDTCRMRLCRSSCGPHLSTSLKNCMWAK